MWSASRRVGIGLLTAVGCVLLGAPAAADTILSLPDEATAPGGGSVSVPLSAIPATGIQGIDLTVEFDPAVIVATGVTKTPLSTNFTLTFNLGTPGVVRISLFDVASMSGSGPIVEIQFDVLGSAGQTSVLDLTHGQINEGAIPTTLDDGTFAVCSGASPEVGGVDLSKAPLTTLQWTGQFAAVYDVAGGVVAQLRVDGGSGGALCLADDLAPASWTDARPDPSAGSAYYYLVRAQGPCGTGSYGLASSGAARVPALDCP